MIRIHRTNRSAYFSSMTPGWILGVIFFAVGVLSLLVLNRIGGTNFSLCPFQVITGLPCFLCGGTTASLNLASGNFSAALVSNPLVTISLILFASWSLLWVGFGLRAEVTLPVSSQTSGMILCVVINWAYMINQRANSPALDYFPLKSHGTERIHDGIGRG